MGYEKYVKQTFQLEFKGEKGKGIDYSSLYKSRMIEFRKCKKSIERLERPTNIARARELGYKAKKGIFVARVRVRKGSGAHSRPSRGRRPKRMGVTKLTRKKSIQSIAEQRVGKKFPNSEVLNSYWIGEDGLHKYFEVILVDTKRPEILADKELKWIAGKTQKKRVERGLTSAGKKSRGHKKRGKGTEKTRPSLRAKKRTGK